MNKSIPFELIIFIDFMFMIALAFGANIPFVLFILLLAFNILGGVLKFKK